MIKFGSICYLPPPGIGPTEAFLANIATNPPRYPIYFYSDWDWEIPKSVQGEYVRVHSPECSKTGNVWTVPKMAFMLGIKTAVQAGLDYFINLEVDCRVRGVHWDDEIMTEFKRVPDAVCGGTMYVMNGYNDSAEWTKSLMEWTAQHLCPAKPFPNILFFGHSGCAEWRPVTVYPNGAFTVMQTQAAMQCFNGLKDMGNIAINGTAYDMTVGFGLKSLYGKRMLKLMVPLTKVFSYYGNLLFNEPERLQLLNDGACCGVHQVKANICTLT